MSLHPIVQAFQDTDDTLALILEEHHNPHQYLESVFIELNRFATRREFNQKILLDIDQAVVSGHSDLNLYLLFIVQAIHYAIILRQPEKGNSLYKIASSSVNQKTNNILKTELMMANAHIKGMEFNYIEKKQLMIEAMAFTDRNSPRFKLYLLNFAQSLALEGSLKELNPKDLELLNSFKIKNRASVIARIKLCNALLIGDYQEGYDLINKYREIISEREFNDIEMAFQEFKIISGELNESNFQQEQYKLLARAYSNLLSSNFEEAIKCYRSLIGDDEWQSYKAWILAKNIPLHIELSMGKKEKVRFLLNEKKAKGDLNYLDDLFYGRLYLLENNEAEADKSFIRLIENVTRCGAMNRLIFELQFAKEMKLADIILLTKGWKKPTLFTIKNKQINSPILIDKGIDLLVGNSSAIRKVKELVKKYSSLKASILVTGETGTGKELVSRAIHDEGPNSLEPFLAINCGALTDSLLQSELFGYVAGAFTGAQKERQGIFEAAGKGTVFLDEFGDISPLLQVSLLRVLESNEIRMIGGTVNRKIECRIVIATNVDLQKVVREKKFREDLYFRLTGFEIRIPSLKERLEDLPFLINHFLNNDGENLGKPKKISKELLDALTTYHWPGNIRELKNEIDRLKILHFEKDFFNLADFDFKHLQNYLPIVVNKASNTLELIDDTKHQALINNYELSVTSEKIVRIFQKGSKVQRRQSFIKDLFKQYKKLTRSQIIEMSNVCQTTASLELQMLCDEGFIVRRMPTKSPRTNYFELVEK